MKYDTKRKKIKVETQLRNKLITIKITDHGQGIPKADQEFIFDRFTVLINLVPVVKVEMGWGCLLLKN